MLAAHSLKGVIALWGGWQKSLGRGDSEGYRRFFHRFGIDVLSAQALPAADAERLREQISNDLTKNNITELAA